VGNAVVCGTSTLMGLPGSSDMCVREATFADASELCQEMGARLCTADELVRGESNPSACGYDSIFAWTWAGDRTGACPSGNQSLGVAGAPGAWYSFSAAARHTYHEIQLRTDGDCFHSISTDIMDSDAVLMHPVVSPSLHRRSNGVMLRWNITSGGGPCYVRVTSPELDSLFSMVAVTPPEYRQAPISSKSWPNYGTERIELSVRVGYAASIDIGFNFPFFGLVYDRIWVSSAGYVAFEQPLETDVFVGMDVVHSAAVAAVGVYDLAHPGATLTVAHVGTTQLEVVWHAPLYDSMKFTDVGLRLGSDGTIVAQWKRIVLEAAAVCTMGCFRTWCSTKRLCFEVQLRTPVQAFRC
jgi:hypothetical protein